MESGQGAALQSESVAKKRGIIEKNQDKNEHATAREEIDDITNTVNNEMKRNFERIEAVKENLLVRNKEFREERRISVKLKMQKEDRVIMPARTD